MEDLPDYFTYKAHVDLLVTRGELSVDQGIILCRCFNATLENTPVHINNLMYYTNLNWVRINAVVNGLVCRGAIRKIEKKYYMV